MKSEKRSEARFIAKEIIGSDSFLAKVRDIFAEADNYAEVIRGKQMMREIVGMHASNLIGRSIDPGLLNKVMEEVIKMSEERFDHPTCPKF